MTEEGRATPWIVRQIEGNLWAVLAAAGAAYGAYLTGTTTTEHRLGQVEKDMVKLEERLDALTPRVDRVEVQTALEREERMKGDGK